MVEQMLSGNDVVLIDYEDDATTHIGRMRQMGVSDETIAEHFIYIQPNEKWDGAAKATPRRSGRTGCGALRRRRR
jgi:hypothetical protein